MEPERRNLKRKPLSDCSNILTTPTTNTAVRNPTIHSSSKTSLLPAKLSKSKSKFPLYTKQTDENSFTTSTGSNNNDENPRILSIPSKSKETSADFGSENPRIRERSSSPTRLRKPLARYDAENPKVQTHPWTTPRLKKPLTRSDAEQIQIHPPTTPRLKKPLTRSDAKHPGIPAEPSTPLRPDDTESQNDGFRTIYTRRRTVEKTNDKGKQVASAVPFDCSSAEKACTSLFPSSIRDNRAVVDREAAQFKSCTAIRPRAAKKQRLSLPDRLPDRIMPPDPDFIASQVAYFKDVDAFELQEESVSESELE
ncbi:uncharacterized protein LOC113323017 isoform X2 [Papaver somniferum]|uniref:uncharacterized protein LOC113323017 isoform X2 n=1 Tax=Papaver somniferum TaxID=3469 RepID=UPI000E700D7E|nr:uncharacterized protein LOC113323017 isoform X2 [Papaver somniferum]